MPVEAPLVFGTQTPRFGFAPPTATSTASADDAIRLMDALGQPMDPWQQNALRLMLGETVDGTWAARDFALVCARQNGKNSVLEARELAGLLLFGEQRIVHSAHEASTADEAFKRMAALTWSETAPAWLREQFVKPLGSPGRMAIRTRWGAQISYRTRTKGGARGFSAPVVIFDEAQELTGEQFAAIEPVVSSFKHRQLIYTGTVLAEGVLFRGLVDRGRRQHGSAYGYAEWSAPEDATSDDVDAILQANPGIGYRPGLTVQGFLDALETWRAVGEERRFREERLSIWPDAATLGQMIPVDAWTRCRVDWQLSPGTVVDHIGVASSVDGAWSAVGVAFEQDGRTFVELAKYEPGTDWVIPYVQGLVERRRPRGVFLDKGGPASKSLSNGLAAVLPRGVLEETSTSEMQAATATFIDAVGVQRIAHAGRPQLDASVTGVRQKLVGDARMFDRRKSPVVVAPVEAVTLAAWGLLSAKRPSRYDSGDLLVL